MSHLLVDWVGLRWWNTQIKVNQTHVHEQLGHPVYLVVIKLNQHCGNGVMEHASSLRFAVPAFDSVQGGRDHNFVKL